MLGLKEGCPDLQTLVLRNNSVDVLSDALGLLRSFIYLDIFMERHQ